MHSSSHAARQFAMRASPVNAAMARQASFSPIILLNNFCGRLL
jgi:hypothetical protein